jgi:hypothetical protein
MGQCGDCMSWRAAPSREAPDVGKCYAIRDLRTVTGYPPASILVRGVGDESPARGELYTVATFGCELFRPAQKETALGT